MDPTLEDAMGIEDEDGPDSEAGERIITEELPPPSSKREQQKALIYDENDPNLVYALKKNPEGAAFLKKQAAEISDNFEEAWEASKQSREQFAANTKVYYGDLPIKAHPWKDCANVHIPVAQEVIGRVVTRLYGEVFGDPNNIVGFIANSEEAKDKADALTAHIHFQLTEIVQDFFPQMQMAAWMHIFHGDWPVHCYWSKENERWCTEVLTPDQFFRPAGFANRTYDFSGLPFYGKIMNLYPVTFEQNRDDWDGVDEILEMDDWGQDADIEHPAREEELKRVGMDKVEDSDTVSKSAKTRKVLHYEGWMRLPAQDRLRWCLAIYDVLSKRIMKLTIHERVNWRDRRRYEIQARELNEYRQAKAAFLADQDRFAMETAAHGVAHEGLARGMNSALAMGADPMMVADGASGEADALAQVQPQPPMPAPTPPSWASDPDKPEFQPELPRTEPIRLFVSGRCMESPSGLMGMGFGQQETDYNRSVNTLMNQFTDAGSLGNSRSYLAKSGLEFKETLEIAPGKINYVEGQSTDSLDKALVPIEVGQANQQLFDVIQFIKGSAESVMQSPEVLSGDPGKSGETARGIAARIEQAVKQLSVVADWFTKPLRQIFANICYLNSVNLREEELFEVVDPITQFSINQKVRREWYEEGYALKLSTDLRFNAQAQRVNEADEFLKMITSIQPAANCVPLLHAAFVNVFKARRLQFMIPLLGPPPPAPVTPFDLAPPPPPGMPGAPGAATPPTQGGEAAPGAPAPPEGMPPVGPPPQG